MIDLNAEAFIISALLLYPTQVASLIKKVGHKQINQVYKKSNFMGYQEKSWTDILKHELFTKIGEDIPGEHAYTWLLSHDEDTKLSDENKNDLAEETLQKLYQIYVARSSSLFSPEHILLYVYLSLYPNMFLQMAERSDRLYSEPIRFGIIGSRPHNR